MRSSSLPDSSQLVGGRYRLIEPLGAGGMGQVQGHEAPPRALEHEGSQAGVLAHGEAQRLQVAALGGAVRQNAHIEGVMHPGAIALGLRLAQQRPSDMGRVDHAEVQVDGGFLAR